MGNNFFCDSVFIFFEIERFWDGLGWFLLGKGWCFGLDGWILKCTLGGRGSRRDEV